MKVIRLFVFKEKNRGKKFFMVFTLNFYFMRKFLLFGIVSCLILAGCNTKDELLSATYTDPISPIGKNFVLFSNNTSLMIGNNAASQLKPMSILRGKSDLFTNEARNLSMEDAPSEIPAGDNYLEVSGELVIDNENKYDGMNLYVSSGGTLRINSDIAKTSSITVMPGGKMVFSGKNISNVYLLCYGTLEITNASVSIAKDAVIKVAGDFNVSGNLELKDGKMYVAGDLVCGSFAADKTASVHKLAVLHVIGNFKQKTNDVYADQIEWMCRHFKDRNRVIVSVHPHNDRGTAIADSELGLLAGADRIEGTLFGNGERTGNVDIITLALNMYTHGVDPLLDFSDIPQIIKLYESVTEMKVYDRQPYSGKFVFAAFSGSHQDAISKGMKYHKHDTSGIWNIPYLPIDPKDLNREYSADVIRINSQSGKGGICYILETNFGLDIPAKMRETVGYIVKDVSDKNHKELTPSDVQSIFVDNFVNLKTPLELNEYHFIRESDIFKVMLSINYNGNRIDHLAEGSGRLDAVSNALKQTLHLDYNLTNYFEHSLDSSSKAEAAAYVSIKLKDKEYWGCGIDDDIICASIHALVSAINNALK